jgi:hypothetical protein
MLCMHLLLCRFSKLLNKNKDCQTIKMVFQMKGKTVWYKVPNGDAEDLSLLCQLVNSSSVICSLLELSRNNGNKLTYYAK